MINGRVESQYINGAVYVRFLDILVGLDVVVEHALDLAEAANDPKMAVQATGIAEMTKSLYIIHNRLLFDHLDNQQAG